MLLIWGDSKNRESRGILVLVVSCWLRNPKRGWCWWLACWNPELIWWGRTIITFANKFLESNRGGRGLFYSFVRIAKIEGFDFSRPNSHGHGSDGKIQGWRIELPQNLKHKLSKYMGCIERAKWQKKIPILGYPKLSGESIPPLLQSRPAATMIDDQCYFQVL